MSPAAPQKPNTKVEAAAEPPPSIRAEALRGAIFGGKVMVLVFAIFMDTSLRLNACLAIFFAPARKMFSETFAEFTQHPSFFIGNFFLGTALIAFYGAVLGALIMSLGALQGQRRYKKAQTATKT